MLQHPANRTHNPPLHTRSDAELDATEVFIADLIACSTCFGHSGARNMLSKQ